MVLRIGRKPVVVKVACWHCCQGRLISAWPATVEVLDVIVLNCGGTNGWLLKDEDPTKFTSESADGKCLFDGSGDRADISGESNSDMRTVSSDTGLFTDRKWSVEDF